MRTKFAPLCVGGFVAVAAIYAMIGGVFRAENFCFGADTN